MFSSQSLLVESTDSSGPEQVSQATREQPDVQETLSEVRRIDRWIFSETDAKKIDFPATLAHFSALFDSILGGPTSTGHTLAKLLATALLIAIGRRSSPVWFESALVFRSFARLCSRPLDYGRAERRFLRCFSSFQRAYVHCHVLVLAGASEVLSSLEDHVDHEDEVESDLNIYHTLRQPAGDVRVPGSWPGPKNAEWQDASLMTWLYGRIYDTYAESKIGIQSATSAGEAGDALQPFAECLGADIAPIASVFEARARLDELMQRYTDEVNNNDVSKKPRGPTGSGSVLGYVEYVKDRMLATNVVMEYFVNVVCQFPTFESSQFLPETMRQVALAVLQLQMQLSGLVDSTQLSELAHELYSRLETNEEVSEQGPVDKWINAVLDVYHQFERECAPALQAVNNAVHEGKV